MSWPLPNISATIHGLTLDEAYRQLDTQISSLQARLYSLRTLRNSLAPISKVPTELLSKIFCHTQEHDGLPFYDDMAIKTRFYVSWVCRHWRDTALVTPNLWTVIAKYDHTAQLNLDFIQEMLLRSRNLPLTVGLFKPSLELLQVSLSQMARVQHLRLLAPRPGPGYDGPLSRPAPLLSFLELQNFSLAHPFSGIHPHLCHLRIARSIVDTTTPISSPTLTNLHIAEPVNRLPVNNLIAIISSIPNLMEFSLIDCFMDGVTMVPAERISRPALQHVSITDVNIRSLFGFLARFSIPQATILITWPQSIRISHQALRHYSDVLQSYLRFVPFEIRYLHITNGDDSHIKISSTSVQHRYALRFPHQPYFETGNMADIVSPMNLASLEIISANTLLPGSLLPRLKDLNQLKNMTLYKNKALQELVNTFAEDFPAIQQLMLCEIQKQEYSEVDGLYEALKLCRLIGCGLNTLVLNQCPGVDSTRFEDVVDNLVVVA